MGVKFNIHSGTVDVILAYTVGLILDSHLKTKLFISMVFKNKEKNLIQIFRSVKINYYHRVTFEPILGNKYLP